MTEPFAEIPSSSSTNQQRPSTSSTSLASNKPLAPNDDSEDATVPSKRARYSLSSSSSTTSSLAGDERIGDAVPGAMRKRRKIETAQLFLPCTVLEKIFEFLPENDLLNEVQFVNKHWHHVVNTSSACFSSKMFRLDKLLSGRRTKPQQYEYMCKYLARYGKFLKKLTISMNGRTINRDQTLQFLTHLDNLFSEQDVRFYRLKKLSLSNLRLERHPWRDRRSEMTELFIKILKQHVPASLERLWVHDVLLEPQAAVQVIDVLSDRLSGLQELDLEELITTREPDRDLEAIITEQENGELLEQTLRGEQNEMRRFREARDTTVPRALAGFLCKAASLRKLILNYTYLTESLVETILAKSPTNCFGKSLTDFHIRVDHMRTPRIVHDNFDLTNPIHPNPPTLKQFSQLTAQHPAVRFSVSFEREMRYEKHRQVLGGGETPESEIFRLHRLEIRGDAFSDTTGNEPSLSTTMIRIVPNYGRYLNKLVLDWYNPVEYLNEEIFKVLDSCPNLTVLKMKLFMEFSVVKELLNMVRFCEELTQEQIVEFEDFPECIPCDMTKLPRKLKVLKIVRYCFESHEDEFGEPMEDDSEWIEWKEFNHIENEYEIAVNRLNQRGEFDYQRTVAY